MSQEDPGRLLDTTDDPLLRELLGAGERELPSPEQVAALAAKLPAPGGGGGGGGGGNASLATKGALGLAALAALAAVIVVRTQAPPAAAPPAPAPAPVPAPSSVPEADPAPEPVRSSDPAPPAKAAAAAAPVESEIQLLRRAQDLLRESPAAALSACMDHAKHYPRGELAPEREVLAVDALSRLGRSAEALRRARAFVSAHPDSGHRARLERLVGEPL